MLLSNFIFCFRQNIETRLRYFFDDAALISLDKPLHYQGEKENDLEEVETKVSVHP